MIAALDPASDLEDCLTSGRAFTNWINPGCGIPSPFDIITDPIGSAADTAFMTPWENDVKEGVGETIKTMVTFWIDVPNPDVGDIGGRESDIVSFLQSSLMPLVALIMCFTIVIGAVTIAWTQRTAGLKNILGMLLAFLAVDAVGAGAIAVALQVTDYFSQELIERSTDGTSFANNLVSMFNSGGDVGGTIVLIVMLLTAALIAAFTCILMIARGGILLALTGAMLLAVAMSPDGRMQVLRHYLAWIWAFVLYKLAGAIVFSVGFRLLGTDTAADGQGLLQILYGLTMLVMVVLALPATIRIVVPAVAPAAQGRGAGAVGAGVVAAGVTSLIRR